jgi:hypothetical protein
LAPASLSIEELMDPVKGPEVSLKWQFCAPILTKFVFNLVLKKLISVLGTQKTILLGLLLVLKCL